MNSTENKPLKIVSASAGSGKTFNLVLTYLKLILKDEENASNFSSIIAMTFTNKAASEMKSRIIDALNVLSNTNFDNSKERNYLAFISKELNLEEKHIQFRSKKVLKQILHQYENFNVLTIDKFNLRLIRSFSRDLNINNDFQTTTNEKDVLSQIVDQLFSEINQENQQKLTEIALKFAKENMEEEIKWDFKNNLKKLAEILLKEQNMTAIEEILLQDFSIQNYEFIKSRISVIKNELEEEARKLHAFYFTFDSKDFPGGKNSDKAFEKLIGDVFQSEHDNFFSPAVENHLRGSSDAKKEYPNDLKEKAQSFMNLYAQKSKIYFELSAYKTNFFNVAILQLIAKELNNYKKSDNIVLISEFNKLISDLLKNEEAPYIYERIGNRYKHFLLDEFQDTSLLQWTNLIPLVHESLGNLNQNLIVGDPKQSIYRFKNGMAEQFVSLPKIYNPENDSNTALKSEYFEEMGEKISLKQNYRSKKEIVEFNNLFFKKFRDFEEEIMGDFYQDVFQEAKGESGAYVYLESFKKEKDKEEDDEDSGEEFDFLIEWIEDCKKDGYDNGDICILGYRTQECNAWANFLSKNDYKVVSTDSLLLGSDPSVKLILAYIKWRINPIGELEAKKFSEMYFDLKKENTISTLQKYWKIKEYKDKKFDYFDSKAFICDEFASEESFFFHYENLYQLLQKLYLLLDFKELNNPYLHQFSDYVFNFDLNFGPDLSLFIENFNNDGHKIPVQIPENKEAIKIMTGHKSKGLEFPIVLIPSLDWKILMQNSKYLIKSNEHYLYSGIKESSKIDAIHDFYKKEFAQAYLDKINLNYVIFTRAKDRMYIRNITPNKEDRNSYSKRLDKIISSLENSKQEAEKTIFEMGSKTKKIAEFETVLTEEFNPKYISDNLWFPDIALQNKELIEENALSENKRFGNQLHEVLSLINSIDEIDSKIQELILKGKIELDLKSKIKNKLKEIFDFEAYKNLFSDAKTILREQSIVVNQTEIKRPDLIILKENETLVIDYKTGVERQKHLKQVSEYRNVLETMNFPNVNAYVFYTNELNLVELQ
jgi:ATP-dependent exoDNAse (exonuclease V) beta subunit